MAVGLENGIGLWDLQSGDCLKSVPLPSVHQVAFEPGSLLSNGVTGLRRWPIRGDAAAPDLLRIGPSRRLSERWSTNQISCSADGRVIASAVWDGGLVLRRDQPDPLVRLVPHRDVRSVAVAPDGQWIATSSFGADLPIKVWEPQWESGTATCVRQLPAGHGAHAVFSPDGHWFAASGDAVTVWATDSWVTASRFATVRNGVLAFSPDSNMLAFETGQGVLQLVDPASGREFARLEDPNQDRAGWIAFTPDGTALVVNGEGQALHVWDLRLIREELAAMGLDWDLPTYPPKPSGQAALPLQVKIDLGDLDPDKSKTIPAQR